MTLPRVTAVRRSGPIFNLRLKRTRYSCAGPNVTPHRLPPSPTNVFRRQAVLLPSALLSLFQL